MTLDEHGKYVVPRETITVRPLIVAPPAEIPWPDRLDNENPKYPWDADVKAKKSLTVDCSLLIGGDRYGEEDSGTAGRG